VDRHRTLIGIRRLGYLPHQFFLVVSQGVLLVLNVYFYVGFSKYFGKNSIF
jgi:hypothetical protein